ncbi:MAG: DUF2239 family protein, partial [Comamonadaceae bacterium]
MHSEPSSSFTAFAGFQRIAAGTRAEVTEALRRQPDATPPLFVFDDVTGEPIDLDLREHALEEPAPPVEEAPSRGVGRPKLGVHAARVFHQLAQGDRGAAGLAVEPVPVARQERDLARDHAELGPADTAGRRLFDRR